MKFVSIITGTKNRRDFLPRATRSVLAQTDPRWEWVVFDNGESIEDLIPDDDRIQYHYGEASGSADAFRQALELAHGTFVIPLGDDDELTPDTVRSIIEVMTTTEYQWGYAMTDYVRDGEVIMRLGEPWDLVRFRTFFYLGGAVFWRKSLSDRLGGFNPAFNLCGDYDLYLRFGEDSTPIFLPERTFYIYHDHPGTETRVQGAEQGRKVDLIRTRPHA